MKRCKICGGYNDPTEWPESDRINFDPNMCYNCFRNSSARDDEIEDEPVEVDDDPDGLRAADEAERLDGEEDDND